MSNSSKLINISFSTENFFESIEKKNHFMYQNLIDSINKSVSDCLEPLKSIKLINDTALKNLIDVQNSAFKNIINDVSMLRTSMAENILKSLKRINEFHISNFCNNPAIDLSLPAPDEIVEDIDFVIESAMEILQEQNNEIKDEISAITPTTLMPCDQEKDKVTMWIILERIAIVFGILESIIDKSPIVTETLMKAYQAISTILNP